MRIQTVLKILLPMLILVGFLAGVVIFDRAQSAKEQALLATASSYIPQTTTTVPPTTAPVKAPELSVMDKRDHVFTMENFLGKPTVLCFWTMDNQDSQAELSIWDRILLSYGDRVNLVVVHVAAEEADRRDVLNYIDDFNYTFTPYFDNTGDAARAYDVGTFPTAFFINSEGNMKARARGNINAEGLATALELIGLTQE